MDREEEKCESMGWNKMTQERLLWQALVKSVISFKSYNKAGSSFSCPN